MRDGYYKFTMPQRYNFSPAGFVLIKKDGDRWYELYIMDDGTSVWVTVDDIKECVAVHKYSHRKIDMNQVEFYSAII